MKAVERNTKSRFMKSKKTIKPSKIGYKKWLEKNPERKGELEESLEWFFQNRDARYGWSAVHKTLTSLSGWETFPVGVKALSEYGNSFYKKGE